MNYLFMIYFTLGIQDVLKIPIHLQEAFLGIVTHLTLGDKILNSE